MQVTSIQELPINDYLQDDMLLKVTDSDPWYATIVNIMVGFAPLKPAEFGIITIQQIAGDLQ